MTALRSMSVRQLIVGDVVHAHGMLCLVVAAPKRSISHPDDNNGVYYTSAIVLNAAEVHESGQVPYSFMRKDENGRRRWSLQGNDLAQYGVDRSTWHGPLTASQDAYAKRYGWTVADVCNLMTGDREG